MNNQEFIEYLVEDGLDDNTIIDHVLTLQKRVDVAESNSLRLTKFLKEAISRCWMGKSWTPQQIREKGVELGLLVKKGECTYSYSEAIKKAHPNL
jgi:hypothetical protein